MSENFTHRQHLPALDGLRGVAILLVLMLHFSRFEPATLSEDLFWKATRAGWIGVDLFFVLSGFLITGILIDTKDGDHFFRTFYTRRVLRIFPLYYGYLAVLFVVAPMLYRNQPAVVAQVAAARPWYWMYLVNVRVGLLGWGGAPLETAHFWSLSVEEQFYLVWPLVVFVLSRRALTRTCLGVIVGSFVLRAGLELATVNRVAIFVLMPTRMDSLAVGALLAIAARSPAGLRGLVPYARVAGPAATSVIMMVVIADHGFGELRPLMEIFGLAMLAVLFGCTLVWALTSPETSRLSRTLNSGILRGFGKYSYGLYVLHMLSPTTLAALGVSTEALPLVAGSQIPRVTAVALLSLALASAFAYVSWHCYEKHFLRLKDRVGFSRRRPAGVIAPLR